MRLLLDTHILVWVALSTQDLSEQERALLSGTELEIVCSAVSLWELRLKWNSLTSTGLRKGPIAPELLLEMAQSAGWTLLPVLPEHTVAALQVAIAHRDPFDELLLAQAQVEGLRLFTRDRALAGHPLAYR